MPAIGTVPQNAHLVAREERQGAFVMSQAAGRIVSPLRFSTRRPLGNVGGESQPVLGDLQQVEPARRIAHVLGRPQALEGLILVLMSVVHCSTFAKVGHIARNVPWPGAVPNPSRSWITKG
jgi:hypothetical protein